MRDLQPFPAESTYQAVIYPSSPTMPRGSLHCYLRDSSVDERSGTLLGAGSLALRYILPVYDLENNVPANKTPFQELVVKEMSEQLGDSFGVHVTGSSTEGLDVPPFTTRDDSQELEATSATTGPSKIQNFSANSAGACGYTAGQTEFGSPIAQVSSLTEISDLNISSHPPTQTPISEPPVKNILGPSSVAPFYTTADTDIMLEMKRFPVALQPGSGVLFLEEDTASHAGYTRVRPDVNCQDFQSDFALKSACKSITVGPDASVCYLSVDGVNDRLLERIRKVVTGADVTRQGPAINTQEEELNTRRVLHRHIADMDFVPALPLSENHPAFDQWLDRVSSDGIVWPPEELREDIRRDAKCFLVGAGHASSVRRDLEWRISFSDPEKRLASSLSPIQRKVYKLIKLLQKCFLKEPKVLVTYHLKTMMFWELEQCGVREWREENLFQHTLCMLNRMEKCLERHCIPSYFLPQNNLISHISVEHVTQTLATVRQIRRRPLQHIYKVDDQLRFDFSSLAPLSRLHRPLLVAVLAADTAAVPEALVLSLLQQVQSDVHRGVVVSSRCTDLLHDAWEVLLPGPGGPHPVHDDWVVFAAAAAFTSMELHESAWVLKALQVALQEEDRPEFAGKQLSHEEKAALPAIIEKMGVEKANSATGPPSEVAAICNIQLVDLLRAAEASGTLRQPSAVSFQLSVRQLQLELQRDMKNKQSENIAGNPPLLTAVERTMVELALTELRRQDRLKEGALEVTANMEAALYMYRELPKLSRPGGSVMEEMMATVQEIVGAPQGLLEHIPEMTGVVESLRSICSALDDVLMPAKDQPKTLPFEQNPKSVAILPMHMINMYIHLLGIGISEETIDLSYTAFFNMVGFFVKHKWFRAACRMCSTMTCSWLTTSELEQKQVLYDLHRAPLLLHNMAAPVQALLRLTSCRAAMGVIYRFVDFVNMLYDRELMGKFVSLPDDLNKLEKLVLELPSVPEDVQVTHHVMRLCSLHVCGWDTDECLRHLQVIAGQGTVERARHILATWQIPVTHNR